MRSINNTHGHALFGGVPVFRQTAVGLALWLGCSAYGQAQEPFRDATAESGIVASGRGRGVAVCDVNADGKADLFLCMLDGPNLLYVNEGSGHFKERGSGTPLATGGATMVALWADLDEDGDEDVLIGNQDEPTRLYRNQAGNFTEVTSVAGIVLTAKVQSGSMLDYDGDGRLDIYLACLNDRNRLYRNLGNLTFREVGEDAGTAIIGLNMQSVALDYDLDGDPDLYVVRDGSQPNVLLRNDGGVFTDVSAASGAGLVGDGMGVEVADYDQDGDFDLYVTNLYENFLLENLGNGTFRERGFDAGVNDLGMGWGTAWIDYDLDGLPDLYLANETGFTVGGRRYNNLLYHNDGYRFSPAAPTTMVVNSDRSSYGTVTADFNDDGLPDLYVANSGEPGQLFLNTTVNDHHWIALELFESNRHAIGARADLWVDGNRRSAEVRAGGSFASEHERILRFGLGGYMTVDSAVIRWSDGALTRRYDLEADQSYRIYQGDQHTTPVVEAPAKSFNAYPNPNRTGHLYLGRALESITMVDPTGRSVLSLAGKRDEVEIPISLPAGVYRIIGYTDETRYIATVIYDPG